MGMERRPLRIRARLLGKATGQRLGARPLGTNTARLYLAQGALEINPLRPLKGELNPLTEKPVNSLLRAFLYFLILPNVRSLALSPPFRGRRGLHPFGHRYPQ